MIFPFIVSDSICDREDSIEYHQGAYQAKAILQPFLWRLEAEKKVICAGVWSDTRVFIRVL